MVVWKVVYRLSKNVIEILGKGIVLKLVCCVVVRKCLPVVVAVMLVLASVADG